MTEARLLAKPKVNEGENTQIINMGKPDALGALTVTE